MQEYYQPEPEPVPDGSQDLFSDHEEEEQEPYSDHESDADEAADQYSQSQQGREQEGDEQVEDDGPLSQESTTDELLEEIHALREKGCKCKNINHMLSLAEMDIYQHVLDMRALLKSEKDMYIMGKLSVKSLSAQTRHGDRKRKRYTYTVDDNEVCLATFLLYHDLGEKELQNIRDHVAKNGICPRRHGNTGRTPAHAVKYEDTRNVVRFLRNYAAEAVMPRLPFFFPPMSLKPQCI